MSAAKITPAAFAEMRARVAELVDRVEVLENYPGARQYLLDVRARRALEASIERAKRLRAEAPVAELVEAIDAASDDFLALLDSGGSLPLERWRELPRDQFRRLLAVVPAERRARVIIEIADAPTFYAVAEMTENGRTRIVAEHPGDTPDVVVRKLTETEAREHAYRRWVATGRRDDALPELAAHTADEVIEAIAS